MGSYVPSTEAERREMLKAIGLTDYRELYRDVPEKMYLDEPLNIPEGMSELEVSNAISAMAAKNKVFKTVLRGAGAYDHYIPSIVKYIPTKEEFLTAYTPYQAEMSQGVLQSIFEYQTMICELTGMDVSNASVYDGATAAGEAAAMCRDRKRRVTLVSGASHPDTINTVRTYCYGTGDEMRIVPMKDGKTEFDPHKGLIHFGDLKNDPEHYSGNVLAVKSLFDLCGIDYKIDADMLKGIWFKFMCNVAENMTCAMFGVPFGAFQKNDDANFFRHKAMWEVIRIANKLGIDIGQNEIDRQEHTLGRLPYENKPSTLQDLEVGKRTEVDMFAGTVVRLGKELGVETPVCECFLHGIHLIEARMFKEI